MSVASSSKTPKAAAASAPRKVPVDAQHKGASVSGASKVCKTKAAPAKGCVKGLKTTIKSKSLVSKSKTNAPMAAGKKIKGKQAVAGAVKKVVPKKKVPIKSKTAPQTGGSKVKPKPNTMDNKSAVEEAGGAPKSIEKIVTESVLDADETVDDKPALPEVERSIFQKPVNTASSESAPDADTVPEKPVMMGGDLEESVSLQCTYAGNQAQTAASQLQQKPVTPETVDDESTMEVGGVKLTTAVAVEIHEEGMPGDAENQPEAGQNKNRPVSVKEIVEVKKLTIFNLDPQPDAVKCIQTEDDEPMQLEETQATQVQEANSGTFLERENSPPSDISADEPIRKPAVAQLETSPPGSPVKASQHAEPNLPGAAQPTAETPGIKTEALDVQQSDDELKTQQEGRFDTWLMLPRDLESFTFKNGILGLPVVKQTKLLWGF